MDNKKLKEFIERVRQSSKPHIETGKEEVGNAEIQSREQEAAPGNKYKWHADRGVFEDKSQRTLSSRCYLTERGVWKTVVSGYPQHYYNAEESRYRSIDNRLELKGKDGDEDDFEGYENKYNFF